MLHILVLMALLNLVGRTGTLPNTYPLKLSRCNTTVNVLCCKLVYRMMLAHFNNTDRKVQFQLFQLLLERFIFPEKLALHVLFLNVSV